MLMLGCDVYKPGMKGIGAAKLEKLIESCKASSEEDLYRKLYGHFKTRNKLTDLVIDTYIDSLIYEPTNPAPDAADGVYPARTFLFGRPQFLTKYNQDFAIDEEFRRQMILPGPDISTCKGVGNSPHQFLSSDGVSSCFRCTANMCSYCQEKIDGDIYCLACYASESISPTSGTAAAKTIREMREELVQDNFDGARDLSSDEVEDVYEMMEYLRLYREQGVSVPYPLYPTSEMDSSADVKWEELLEIDFKEGAVFLAEPNLEAKFIPGILELMAELVRFESGKKTEWTKDHAVYESLPQLFIDFAGKSRVDSGFRLLMRCVRHAFDSRTPSLDKNTAMLVVHDGDVGIHLNASIPASMKKNVYETGIVATAKDLLCCKCTCQCGSQNDQRIVCVHVLAVLYLLTLLLFEDLAEHLLLELSACLSGDIWETSQWSDNGEKSIKRSIVTLMEAAGEPIGSHDAENSSIRDQ